MNEKAKLDEMKKKYKDEMLKLYNKSPNYSKDITPKAVPQRIIEEPIIKAPTKNNYEAMSDKSFSPDDVLARELGYESATDMEENAPQLSEEKVGGNYSLAESLEADEILNRLINNGMSDETMQENQAPENYMPDGIGTLEVSVTSASNAYPIADATVIITSDSGERIMLLNIQTTNENGNTSAVELKTPNISISNDPNATKNPYASYQLGVYKEGFYPVTELSVPVFPKTNSIQPITLIPVAK